MINIPSVDAKIDLNPLPRLCLFYLIRTELAAGHDISPCLICREYFVEESFFRNNFRAAVSLVNSYIFSKIAGYVEVQTGLLCIRMCSTNLICIGFQSLLVTF